MTYKQKQFNFSIDFLSLMRQYDNIGFDQYTAEFMDEYGNVSADDLIDDIIYNLYADNGIYELLQEIETNGNGDMKSTATRLLLTADGMTKTNNKKMAIRDALNNIGLPDLADIGALYTSKDYRRVREAYNTMAEKYGDTFINTLTAETIRTLLK